MDFSRAPLFKIMHEKPQITTEQKNVWDFLKIDGLADNRVNRILTASEKMAKIKNN